MGYRDLDPQPHWELCQFLQKNGHRDCLILLPRGNFKSTVITVSWPAWRLWDDPELQEMYPDSGKWHDANLRFLLSSGELGNSIKFNKVIQDHAEMNPFLKALAGDWAAKKREEAWNQTSTHISTRTDYGQAQDSITAASYKTTKVSQHYDVAILDDLVNDKNHASPTAMQQVDDYLQLLLPILDPQSRFDGAPGARIVVGTRWNNRDLYARVIARDRIATKEGRPSRFKKLIRKAHNKDKTWFYFPSRFTPEYLEQLRTESGMTPYQYSCQYLNDPLPEGDQPFKLSYLKFYHKADLPGSLVTFVLVDPAISDRETAAYTAIVAVSIDSEGSWYVRHCRKGRWLPSQTIDSIWEVCDEFKANMVGIETVAYQRALSSAFRESQLARGRYLRVTELKPDTDRTKEMRITGLEPYFVSGVVHFLVDDRIALNQPRDLLVNCLLEGQSDLVDEVLTFPIGETKDCVDALAYVPQIAYPAKKARPQDLGTTTFAKMRQMLRSAHTERGY